jgi:hypothetical protein
LPSGVSQLLESHGMVFLSFVFSFAIFFCSVLCLFPSHFPFPLLLTVFSLVFGTMGNKPLVNATVQSYHPHLTSLLFPFLFSYFFPSSFGTIGNKTATVLKALPSALASLLFLPYSPFTSHVFFSLGLWNDGKQTPSCFFP